MSQFTQSCAARIHVRSELILKKEKKMAPIQESNVPQTYIECAHGMAHAEGMGYALCHHVQNTEG